MQDGYIVKEFLGGKRNCFFGVFDGHGSDGAKVSSHLVSAMPHFLTNCEAFKVELSGGVVTAEWCLGCIIDPSTA
jgi:serine/threonine protein phosphatase PrpC